MSFGYSIIEFMQLHYVHFVEHCVTTVLYTTRAIFYNDAEQKVRDAVENNEMNAGGSNASILKIKKFRQ